MRVTTLRRSILFSVFSAAAVVLGACAGTPDSKPPVYPAASPTVSPTASPISSPAASPLSDNKTAAKADALTGRWPGVEGTYLDITKKGDKYSIQIKDLDGVQTFEGTAAGDAIEFMRKGKTETIKPSTGDETGMKWLAGEKNCVVVTKGSESFCRK